MDWSFNEHHATREAFCRELIPIVRKEITALVENNAKIIQIDEPALPAEAADFSLFAEAVKEITRDINAYFILNPVYADVSAIWDKLQTLPVDQIHINHVNPFLTLLPLLKRKPTKKDISVGVIETQALEPETPRQLNERLREAVKAVPQAQLWFSFDAGLQTHTVESASRALQLLTETVTKLR
jgi:5-methyltetrahydropteroyltriglutamate--homocysteine methyltransferase